jgi:malate dehydrogenase (oxaloacetate-decarboxylating)(NADP+)
MTAGPSFPNDEALEFHRRGRPGKIEISLAKPLRSERDLSLAYSPGVAAPALAIASDPARALDYTIRGNLVAVITNGTAVLGLGNIGPLAAKPVMEGKAALFKRFADIDSVDLEIDTEDPAAFVETVSRLHLSFGGINLEDIAAPGCFIIEDELRRRLDIPVFHDDQHGTATVIAAGLLNALELVGKRFDSVRLVCNGAGAAGIACLDLLKAMGMPAENIVLCDTKGVIFEGRAEGMNPWKRRHESKTAARTLPEAMTGADVFLGLSVRGALDGDMVRSMAERPVVFALANPDPEVTPEEVASVRSDAIVATGRSDYPNQVNNVLGFPYIFRGALDVRATTIDRGMEMEAARALAMLARSTPPADVASAYGRKRRLEFGPEYILPTPFDPRLLTTVSPAVAEAAIASGVARRTDLDGKAYAAELARRAEAIAARQPELVPAK